MNENGVDGMWKKLLGNRTSTSLRVYVLVLFVDVGYPDRVLFQWWGTQTLPMESSCMDPLRAVNLITLFSPTGVLIGDEPRYYLNIQKQAIAIRQYLLEKCS